tara:strand:- start:1474 stop:2010 length:537 start_codon:yes stop_codon:yes gene_type:complete
MTSSLLNAEEFSNAIKRLSHEIIEGNQNIDSLALIGIRSRGDIIADRVRKNITEISGEQLDIGYIDVTFHRDDFKTNLGTPKVGPSEIMFSVDKKNIILIDDVLYTGRTIRAAMDEIFTFGRPESIKLLAFVDRGHRELPIKADYVGKNYPTADNEQVYVHLNEVDGSDAVVIKKEGL